MTKDELERIKQAYSSGLKVQVWFNGHWENFDIRDYSMFPEPFSEHRLYRVVGSDYADIAEKRIADLEKENEELKKRNGELAGQKASLERWFGEAKEIIKELLESCFGYNSKSVNYEIKAKAEQFLKESKE